MATPSDIYKTPPHDLQAERSILGAVLIDSSAMSLVAEFVLPHHFYAKERNL